MAKPKPVRRSTSRLEDFARRLESVSFEIDFGSNAKGGLILTTAIRMKTVRAAREVAALLREAVEQSTSAIGEDAPMGPRLAVSHVDRTAFATATGFPALGPSDFANPHASIPMQRLVEVMRALGGGVSKSFGDAMASTAPTPRARRSPSGKKTPKR